jgi:excinuclease ABC subunit B
MKDAVFHLHTSFQPTGDQPKAIEQLCQGLESGAKHQTLLGVTGSGKTFTMANVIARSGRPALVMAHNKTLAAQLFMELKEFFPENAVEYFISYYDYYQPEAYLPSSDTYIAKDSSINDDIDKMRHSATMALFSRRDVIVVSSVSCIYGLGSPDAYGKLVVTLKKGMNLDRNDFLRSLIDIQYTRNDMTLLRGTFRVRGDTVDILPAHEDAQALRVIFFGDEIEAMSVVDALTGKVGRQVDAVSIYPNSHYVADRTDIKQIVREILKELGVRLRELKAQNKLVEYQRLEQRTMQDIEMLEHLGYCPGIENYSRFLTGKAPGQSPPTLLDYFPKGFLTIVDESHMTIPQVGGMSRGDRARKQNLVDFGFRLPSALDNRPLNFDEFMANTGQMIYVSATPSTFELMQSGPRVIEQIIRPTGLLDPQIIVKPAKNQVDDLLIQLREVIAKGGRVLVTTLTKKMSEDLTEYFAGLGIRVRYLHSDIDSLERMQILRDLRSGVFDVLIGINLLREGLDLPEVRLVAVMDADKEGFLRSKSALIQTVGRAARNVDGRVLFYADKITDSMKACMEETDRRRAKQEEYNIKNHISPQSVLKGLGRDIREIYGLKKLEIPLLAEGAGTLDQKGLEKQIRQKSEQMKKAAGELEFEKAAGLRDEIRNLRDALLALAQDPREGP